jgi:hypothetical protein
VRYSGIEIPENDRAFKLFFLDPDYVKTATLLSTNGSLDRYIKEYNKRYFTYEGKTESEIERFKFTDWHKRTQFIVMDEYLFIPETHPLFNCYIVNLIGKLYDNVGNIPKLSYSIFLPAVSKSVLASIK